MKLLSERMTKNLLGNQEAQLVWMASLFFMTGAAGLVYQTIWLRLLELYFGVTLITITLIVAAYMAGLGLGSLAGGRMASKGRNNLRLFGLMQLGIGLFGSLSPHLINLIGQKTAGSPYWLVFLLSFSLLLVPTFLMGMTLPLIIQVFVRSSRNSGGIIGMLYGINTLGAAIGALLSGYILIGLYGFNGTIMIAFCINLLAGLGAIALKPASLTAPKNTKKPETASAELPNPTLPLWAVLVSAFLVGFIGMGLEMLWFRLLGIIGKHTAYSFPSVLFVFLVALAFGGWYWGRKADRSRDRVGLFWILQNLAALMAAGSFLLLWVSIKHPPLSAWLLDNFYIFRQPDPPLFVMLNPEGIQELVFSRRILLIGLLEYFLPIMVVVLPAGLFMGGGLPILDRIAIQDAGMSGRRVGDIHLSNIIGAVAGTMVTSLVFLPHLGSEITLKVLSLLALSFPLLMICTSYPRLQKKWLLLPALLLLVISLLPGRGQFYTDYFENATGQSAVIKESGDAVKAITFKDHSANPTGLFIGGIQNSIYPSLGVYEVSAMTCAAAVRPERVLIIGLGGANTAKIFTTLPETVEITIVELLQDLDSFLLEYVSIVREVFQQPGVRYFIDDGRRFLYANPQEQFDLIYIDPFYSYTAGHNNLYSQEAMRLFQRHLSEGGVFCAFIDERHLIPKTAASVFQYSDHFPYFLINSDQPIVYDLDYMATISDTLARSLPGGMRSPAARTLEPKRIMDRKIGSQAETLEWEKHTPILSDMTPWLEYFYLCPGWMRGQLSAEQLRYCSQNRLLFKEQSDWTIP
jgi:predicted membrane-bound spermidine synthase